LRKDKRDAYLTRKFGITQKQWEDMFYMQGGQCPICFKPLHFPDIHGKGKRASPVDHDHKTGRVRGLTCLHCNRFKIAKNTAESAERLVKYLDSKFDGREL
jgi:hypothetical protein